MAHQIALQSFERSPASPSSRRRAASSSNCSSSIRFNYSDGGLLQVGAAAPVPRGFTGGAPARSTCRETAAANYLEELMIVFLKLIQDASQRDRAGRRWLSPAAYRSCAQGLGLPANAIGSDRLAYDDGCQLRIRPSRVEN
ncbi:hypothetical protein [Paenibacillus puerhi]|uniref:hypothetical protein n=1 Tax=Paenibacillus puerhi TaxID=2692622 RepID=UPI00135C9F24|nr:hypothetical protein [Paenibacillus puerhi]